MNLIQVNSKAMRRKKYRIASKQRFTIFIAVTLMLIISATGTALGANKVEMVTHEVEIHYGDTLWDLAQEFGPEHQDVRKTVYEICKINNISAATIVPGEIIRIPAYY